METMLLALEAHEMLMAEFEAASLDQLAHFPEDASLTADVEWARQQQRLIALRIRYWASPTDHSQRDRFFRGIVVEEVSEPEPEASMAVLCAYAYEGF